MGERLFDYRGIRREFTLSESTVRRLTAAGRFPAPERLTAGRVVFRESLVRAAVERLLSDYRRTESAHGVVPVTPRGECLASMRLCRNGHDKDVVGTVNGWCRECRRLGRARYYAANKRKEREYYYYRSARYSAARRHRYQANRETEIQRSREWALRNPERKRANDKRFRDSNRGVNFWVKQAENFYCGGCGTEGCQGCKREQRRKDRILGPPVVRTGATALEGA